MVKYCPSCGTKVKEGSKFCLSCGAELQTKISGGQDTQTLSAQAPLNQQPMQQQTYAPMQPKKSKKGLIIAVIAIITIVIIIAIVLLLLGGTLSGDASKFVGTWESNIGGYSTYEMKFNSDKSFEYGLLGYSIKVGTWDVRNNKLILAITEIGTGLTSQEFDYEFSNGGNTLSLKSQGINVMTLTKK